MEVGHFMSNDGIVDSDGVAGPSRLASMAGTVPHSDARHLRIMSRHASSLLPLAQVGAVHNNNNKK